VALQLPSNSLRWTNRTPVAALQALATLAIAATTVQCREPNVVLAPSVRLNVSESFHRARAPLRSITVSSLRA
jgi:hypothetical protein